MKTALRCLAVGLMAVASVSCVETGVVAFSGADAGTPAAAVATADPRQIQIEDQMFSVVNQPEKEGSFVDTDPNTFTVFRAPLKHGLLWFLAHDYNPAGMEVADLQVGEMFALHGFGGNTVCGVVEEVGRFQAVTSTEGGFLEFVTRDDTYFAAGTYVKGQRAIEVMAEGNADIIFQTCTKTAENVDGFQLVRAREVSCP